MHVAHIALQAVTGIIITWPLSALLPYINRGSVLRRVSLHLCIIGLFAFLWNIFRMASFDLMLTASDIWQDFGGWYFTALLIFGLWAALYYVMQAYSAVAIERAHVESERLRRIEAESLSREAQMKMLRYQLNPHFLFNTLNSVSALVRTNRTREARDMIGQLSNFLRFTLEAPPETLTTLQREFELLEVYLEIESVRYGDRLKVERDIHPETLNHMVPGLILQPLVENALRYAVAGQSAGGAIKLSANYENDRLVLGVGDSGPGFSTKSREGIGLSNIRQRLNTQYDNAAQMELETSELGGAQINIYLPGREAS